MDCYSTGMSGGYFISLTPDELKQEMITKAARVEEITRKPKRERTKFRAHHLELLEKEFQKQSVLQAARRAELAKLLNLKESSLKTWFQNRRRKEKVSGLQKIVNTTHHITVPPTTTNTSVPAPKPTQFYNSASNDETPTLMSNTHFPLYSSTCPAQISPISETVSTQFTQCSFGNTYPFNVQPISDKAQAHNTIEPINGINGKMVYPIVESAYSQPLPINFTDYLYPLTNTTAESRALQFSTDYPLNSPKSAKGTPYTPESVEQQNENPDLYSVIEEYLSTLESVEVQDTNLCDVYNSNVGMDQADTVPSSSAIKWNPSDYVAGVEMNIPLDLIDMFHSN